jgi:hypothetical protein
MAEEKEGFDDEGRYYFISEVNDVIIDGNCSDASAEKDVDEEEPEVEIIENPNERIPGTPPTPLELFFGKYKTPSKSHLDRVRKTADMHLGEVICFQVYLLNTIITSFVLTEEERASQ